MLSYSKLLSVLVPEELTWSVYPNPSDGTNFQVKFATEDLGKAAFVQLQDMSGRQLHQFSSSSLTSTNVKVELAQPLSSGIYIITIAVEDHFTRQKMIVR